MKSFIRKILFGKTPISEYSKITVPADIYEKVYLEVGKRTIDISKNQWLLCIDPVIFGVWLRKEEFEPNLAKEIEYRIYFTGPSNNLDKTRKKAVALLTLTLCDCIQEDNGILLLLKVKKSKIHHLGFIKTYLLFSRYYKKNGLTFSKFKSFTAAYSYPRQIRVVSFRQDDYYNIFPMDLIGEIEQCGKYVFGLRHTNLSLEGIIKTGKLAISEVPFQYKDIIYQLGQHHSSKPPPLDSLPFEVIKSKNFEFYIPAWAENYKEITILKTRNLGSHMLLWGELKEISRVNSPANHLFLIHFLHYRMQTKKGLGYPLA